MIKNGELQINKRLHRKFYMQYLAKLLNKNTTEFEIYPIP